jgi:hypothetical protein
MALARNKRRASEMVGPALPPETNKKGRRVFGACGTDWEEFCAQAAIPSGPPGPTSPDKTRSQLDWIKLFHQQIFFLGTDSDLEAAKSEVFRSLAQHESTDARQAYIRDTFREAAERLRCNRDKAGITTASSFVQSPQSKVDKTQSPPKPLRQTQLNFGILKPRKDQAKHDAGVLTNAISPSKETSFATTVTTSFWSNAPSSSAESGTTLVNSSDDDDAFEPIPSLSKVSKVASSSARMRARLRNLPDITVPSDHDKPSSHTLDLFISSLDSDDFLMLDHLASTADGQIERHTGFVRLELPLISEYSRLPFTVRWEMQRVLQIKSATGKPAITVHDLQREWKRPRTLETLREFADDRKLPFEPGFSDGQPGKSEQITLNAKLEPIPSASGPLFQMVLQPPMLERSCDLQRRFGWDSVLYVDIPSLHNPVGHHKGRRLVDQFCATFRAPWDLMGRKWQLLSIQAGKKKLAAGSFTRRLVLIAIDNRSVTEIFQSLLEYNSNCHQPAAKLYSRIDLAASRTTPIIRLEPGDIVYDVPDKLATEDPEDIRHQDPKLRDGFCGKFDPTMVMDDGCCVMSAWLAAKVADVAGCNLDRRGFQARVAGAKGVWIPSSDPFQADLAKKPLGPHLHINNSQIKVRLPSLLTCDPAYLDFNLVRPNASARRSILHLGYLPILLDRGVERQTIVDVVTVQEQAKVDRIVQAVKDGPEAVRAWLGSKNDIFEAQNREQGIGHVAGFPLRKEERVVQMLEAGFEPAENRFLAQDLQETIGEIMDIEKKSLKISLGRSTTLLGVPDPRGCLLPGEVHIVFAERFVDDVSGESYQMLHGRDILIARSPSLGNWDIQRVRSVFKPELAHLTDTVVFSTRGAVPLASKLSGGDYDGDTFWICFEPKLVNPFKNAPVPYPIPGYEELGITKKKELLSDYVSDPTSDAQWCNWALQMASARLETNLLGVVTLLHENLIYDQGNIDSNQARNLVFLHDYLVDADKQGYEYSNDAFKKWKLKTGIPMDLPDPEYRKFKNEDRTDYPIKAPAKGNIIDAIIFEVIGPMHKRCVTTVQELLGKAESHDVHLGTFHDQMAGQTVDYPGNVDYSIQEEIKHIKNSLKIVRDAYQTALAGKSAHADFVEGVKHLRSLYDAIQPLQPDHPVAREWLRRQGTALSIWDKLKASTLAKFHHDTTKPGKLLYNVAGRELCELKAYQKAQASIDLGMNGADVPRVVNARQWSLMKPRKTKTPLATNLSCLKDRSADTWDDDILLNDIDGSDDDDYDEI